MTNKITGPSESSNAQGRSSFEIEAPQLKEASTQNSFGHTIYNVLKAPFFVLAVLSRASEFLSRISSGCLKSFSVEKKKSAAKKKKEAFWGTSKKEKQNSYFKKIEKISGDANKRKNKFLKEYEIPQGNPEGKRMKITGTPAIDKNNLHTCQLLNQKLENENPHVEV